MLESEIKKNSKKLGHYIFWDFLFPITISLILGWVFSSFFSSKILRFIIEIPYLGDWVLKSPLIGFLTSYSFWIFLFSSFIFVSWFSISWGSIRIPGPARPIRIWWRNIAKTKIKEEIFINPFPPDFNQNLPEVKKATHEIMEKEPLTRVIGFVKRFKEDIEEDKRKGKDVESLEDYQLLKFDEKSRYRHIQVTGGSGSGKSASVIAPMLREDALTSKIGTLTINPKADLYLIKCMSDLVMKRQQKEIALGLPKDKRLPTAVVSFVRKESLAYDPLLYGDADALTKKIIGSAELKDPFYKAFQETWLMSFFRVIKTERALIGRVMLRHLHRFLTKPSLIREELIPFVSHDVNRHRLELLSATKVESLAGIASHVSQLVEDESLSHIFDNPNGHYLDLREILKRGGNIFIEVDNASKSSQGQALGRMIIMELQLFSGARQAGLEPSDIGVQGYFDEFASFAYSDFINLIDKSRSAKIGLLLSHQSIGNLKRDNLSKSFASEIVDNTFSKIFLSVKDETADWAVKQFGQANRIKKTITTGQNLDTSSDQVRENTSISLSNIREDYLTRGDFNLPLGSGYAMIGNEKGEIRSGPCKLGYVDEKDLCTDSALLVFLEKEKPNHPKRPRNGSLIDNDIDPGEPHEKVSLPNALEVNLELKNPDFSDPKYMDLEALEKIKQGSEENLENKTTQKVSNSLNGEFPQSEKSSTEISNPGVGESESSPILESPSDTIVNPSNEGTEIKETLLPNSPNDPINQTEISESVNPNPGKMPQEDKEENPEEKKKSSGITEINDEYDDNW